MKNQDPLQTLFKMFGLVLTAAVSLTCFAMLIGSPVIVWEFMKIFLN